MKLQELKEKSILILGLGREGLSVLNFLKKNFPGKIIGTADKSEGENYLDKVKDYEVIIKSPGVPYLPPIKKARDEGKIITSSTAIFLKSCQGKVIGVTGTKGKSTTSSLIYEVLKNGGLNAYLIGNIGTPALDLLEKDHKDTIFVYEMSSFQLEDLDVSPHMAVITNIYPEHLDHHGDFLLYTQAKNNITRYQKPGDFLIYNEDIPELKVIAQQSKARKIPFSKKDHDIVLKLIPKDALALLGDFNLSNILPAILTGRLFKIADKTIANSIINFKPLPHRLEFVGEVKGRRFYNDSLSTIPQATIGALSALGKRVETLISGGFDRGLDYAVLGETIANSNIKNLILFPTTGEKIWQAVKNHIKSGLSIKKYDISSMEEAVEVAFKVTKRRKIVLLSPASASFNLFKDYEDRGNQFKEFVLQRAKE